jgi:hypothetical protein
MLSLPDVPTMLGVSSLQRSSSCATNAVGVLAVVAKVMAKVTANVIILASGFRSFVFVTVSASAFVVVIGFLVLALLFAIFVANDISLSITMLILSIFLKIMQIDSVGL